MEIEEGLAESDQCRGDMVTEGRLSSLDAQETVGSQRLHEPLRGTLPEHTLKTFADTKPASAEVARQREIFRWMVEEFKVSLFAQELGTAYPVSPKRLDEQRQKL